MSQPSCLTVFFVCLLVVVGVAVVLVHVVDSVVVVIVGVVMVIAIVVVVHIVVVDPRNLSLSSVVGLQSFFCQTKFEDDWSCR